MRQIPKARVRIPEYPAVTVEHIEIHKINEAQAVEITRRNIESLIHAVRISVGMDRLAYAAPGKDIVYLSDCDNGFAVFLQRVEKRGANGSREKSRLLVVLL